MLSIERGETDGSAATSWGNFATVKADWIKDKKVSIILQLALKKLALLGDVPLIMDAAADDSDRKVLELIFARQPMSYPFVTSPDVPADRLQALRRAFDATLSDPEFLADAKQQKLDVDPVSGDEIQSLVRSVYASPPEVIARARAAIKNGTAGQPTAGTKKTNDKRRRRRTMKVTPLSEALGAEITEIDLRQPQDDAAVKTIRKAFDDNIFVVFREQQLSEDDQLRAAGYFGKVHIRRKPVTTRDPGGAFGERSHACTLRLASALVSTSTAVTIASRRTLIVEPTAPCCRMRNESTIALDMICMRAPPSRVGST
jgi:hypothetical protein